MGLTLHIVINNSFFTSIYIISETSKWHKKEITNDEHKINNM